MEKQYFKKDYRMINNNFYSAKAFIIQILHFLYHILY